MAADNLVLKIFNLETHQEIGSIPTNAMLSIVETSRNEEFLFIKKKENTNLEVYNIQDFTLKHNFELICTDTIYLTKDNNYLFWVYKEKSDSSYKLIITDLRTFENAHEIELNIKLIDFAVTNDESSIIVTSGSQTSEYISPLCESGKKIDASLSNHFPSESTQINAAGTSFALLKKENADYEEDPHLIFNVFYSTRTSVIGIIDTKTKTIIREKDLNNGSIWTVVISSDNNYAYVAGVSSKIQKVKIEDLSVVTEYKGHEGDINVIALKSDSNHIYSGGDDKTVREWVIDGNPEEFTILYSHENWVTCLCLSSDSSHLVTGSTDTTVIIYNLETKSIEAKLTDSSKEIWSVRLSQSKQFLMAGDEAGSYYKWNFDTKELTKTAQPHTNRIRCIFIAEDESYFITGSHDNSFKYFELTHPYREVTFTGHTD